MDYDHELSTVTDIFKLSSCKFDTEVFFNQEKSMFEYVLHVKSMFRTKSVSEALDSDRIIITSGSGPAAARLELQIELELSALTSITNFSENHYY